VSESLSKESEVLLQKVTLLQQEIHKQIIGQDQPLTEILIALMAGGHALIEGVPGLAKTLMIRTLARATDLSFKRIQFTPDLMPTDIIGTEILEDDPHTGKRAFRFHRGPIFSHIILADEINRTPPKTQAALLEAMQEREVSYAGTTYPLPDPFFLLATQNPIEQAGTFPLPEAQLDRFLLYIQISYPTEEEELSILTMTTGIQSVKVAPVLSGKDLLTLQHMVREVHIGTNLIAYVNQLVRNTRPDTSQVDFVKEWVRWGAGPRAGQALILGAKAHALLNTRYAVIKEDIEQLAFPVFRHRILMNFRAEAEKITSDQAIEHLLKAVNIPKVKL